MLPQSPEPTTSPSNLSLEVIRQALFGYASDENNYDALGELVADIIPYCFGLPVNRRFSRWQERGWHFTPVHFSYPIPDTRTLKDSLWESESQLVGIDMNEATQLELLLHAFPKFRAEYDRLPSHATDRPHEFHFDNPAFTGTDALALYCMVRHFQPRLVLEVGSGFSSRLSAQAALKNGHTELICIEPFPNDVLAKGFPGLTCLVPKKVEEIDVGTFQKLLQPGDFLFIDTSHVVRMAGDVNYLFLEVLPRLDPGVIIHVHDIFFPGEYPRQWVMNEVLFYSEQYLLQAFLAFNSAFEVLWCDSFLGRKYQAEMQRTFPKSPYWGGASLWMRRKSR